jgi:BirA family biotin operon repressor/biotin-[acetyl-CoA-carboxylase] ligase
LQLPLLNTDTENSFIELQSIDSTNNYALGRIHEGLAQGGSCFFAHEQTQGKGQRGKSWKAEKGMNIQMSVVMKSPPVLPARQFQLSCTVASALLVFFKEHAGDDAKIKWPNDLYWQDRKAGGILIQNIIKGFEWQWAIVGVGLNINQTVFPAELPNPVSLKQITGKNYDPVSLAKQLFILINNFCERLGDADHPFFNIYREHLYKKNETVRLKKDNRIFDALIKDVTDDGRLVIHHGIEEAIDNGQVEWFF